MLVALGFLIVPLQAASAWRIYTSNIQGQNGAEQSVISQKFEGMRRAINSATSPADLQARLNSAGGPSLSLANLATPFPVLRPKLLASLEQAKLNALEQFSSSKPSMIWSLLQRCFHVILSAVGYGLGFAASAQRPDSELTVLQEWKRALNKRKRQAVSMLTLINERESWFGLRNGRQEVLIKLSSRDHVLLRRKLRILRIKLYHKNSRGRRNRAMIHKPGSCPRYRCDLSNAWGEHALKPYLLAT